MGGCFDESETVEFLEVKRKESDLSFYRWQRRLVDKLSSFPWAITMILGGWGVWLSCIVEEVTQIRGKVIANQFHLCVS